jgi:Cu(I)/Ag(I) efflux system membrane protein CusA/SilA
MQRIAAPMVGGLLSATVLTLLILPAIYMVWKGTGLRRAIRREQAVRAAAAEA